MSGQIPDEANYNQVFSNNDQENAKSGAAEEIPQDLIKFVSNVELHPNPGIMLMDRRHEQQPQGQWSGTKNNLDASTKHPRIECDRNRDRDDDGEYEDEGRGWKMRKQCKSSRSAQVHLSCERRRRDRLRQKLTSLKELLPTTSYKSDQASLLDQAIKHIKSLQSQLQVLSMGFHPSHIANMPAAGEFHSIHRPSSSAPGRLEKAGIGIDPGMGFQVPFSPIPFLMAAPTAISPQIVHTVLAPILYPTSTQPLPGESTSSRIVSPSSFNPHHVSNVTHQHEVWTASSHEMPLRWASTGIGHGLGEHGIPSNMFPSTLSDLSASPLSATGLAPTFGSGVQSVAPAPYPASDSVPSSTYPRLSTFSHPFKESGFPIVPRIGPETNQTPLLQDPFATIQSLQVLSSSLSSSSSILEMVNQTYRNTDDTD
ncbi:Transcription factor PIF3 [Sesamum angolense]|uniref:Transcription factor PIF3 n=1 Tax=Sesamum angolense TaxID=2727404 RepID=A0AAE1XD79_9LAMI|nr:Transcription factor PIF3 [Sesamum angolense]